MKENVPPGGMAGEPKIPPESLATVCATESSLVHVTVVPTFTSMAPGLNAKPRIETPASCGEGIAVGAGVGSAPVSGVAVGRGAGAKVGAGVGVAGAGVGAAFAPVHPSSSAADARIARRMRVFWDGAINLVVLRAI